MLTRVSLNDELKDVLVISGGYDESEDTNTVRKADAMGNAIFFVDPDSGERLWWASQAGADLNLDSMTNSIPAAVRVIDIDANGIADRLYAADVGGRVFRIDLPDKQNTRINQQPLLNGSGKPSAKGYLFADLSRQDGVQNNRRFYYQPDVSKVEKANQRFLAVAIGSGYRAHPLVKGTNAVQDRLYVMRDTDIYNAPKAGKAALGNADLTNLVTKNTVSGPNGWYINLRRKGGEKSLARAVTFNNTVFFTTFEPETSPPADICSTASHTGRIYALDVANGKPVINFDELGDEPQELTDRSVAVSTPDILSEVYFNLSSNNDRAPVVDAFIGARFDKQLSRTQLEAIRKVYWQEQIN